MSRELEEYREIQIDLRLLTQALGQLNDEEKLHPAKIDSLSASLEDQAKWQRVKAGFTKRREALKTRMTAKNERKDFLYLNLSQTPLSMVSLAEVIDTLTNVEASFTLEGPNNAWDKLSAFLDYLEQDETRVKGLKAA